MFCSLTCDSSVGMSDAVMFKNKMLILCSLNTSDDKIWSIISVFICSGCSRWQSCTLTPLLTKLMSCYCYFRSSAIAIVTDSLHLSTFFFTLTFLV